MTGIARYVANPQIKALLRESDGIGTPATQAWIIQLLFDRGYVEEKKRLVYSTATGRALIKALPSVTTQPDMTALWESTLGKVQEGEAPLEGFLHAVRLQLGELVARAKSAGPLDLSGAETRPCPAPGCTGSLCKRSGKKGAFWACSRYPDCRETASTEIECRGEWKARGDPKMSAMNAQVKIDDVSALAAAVRALREEIRRLRESTPQSLVDLKAAAAHLGVSTRTLRRWVDAGRVPFRRVGRTLRFPLAALNPR